MAAFKNQRPERLYFHTDEVAFSGRYWQKLQRTPALVDAMEIVPVVVSANVIGDAAALRHFADTVRLRILAKYGGILLDNDSYLVRSLDVFRRFEMVVRWPEGGNLGMQVEVRLSYPREPFPLEKWVGLTMSISFPFNFHRFYIGSTSYRPRISHCLQLPLTP